jgi:hypothetical protein
MPAQEVFLGVSNYCGGQAGAASLGSGDGPLQRSPDTGATRTGAFGAGVGVTSFSAIGRVSTLVVGATVRLIGATSLGDAAGEGATSGAAVPLRTFASGVPCSTAGASVAPQAAAVSVTRSRVAEILFIPWSLTTATTPMFCPSTVPTMTARAPCRHHPGGTRDDQLRRLRAADRG